MGRIYGLLFLAQAAVAAGRVIRKFDADWLFQLDTEPLKHCTTTDFPILADNLQCWGLRQATASSADECRDQCCSDVTCEVWQWCPQSAQCSPNGSCWIGPNTTCSSSLGWKSRGRPQPPQPPKDQCTDARCQANFDDSKWRHVRVPHDFVIEGQFTPSAERGHAYLPRGVGWYRKHFTVPARDADNDVVWLEFDGIYRDSSVWLNGHFIGGETSGYTSFKLALEKYLNYGAENVLAVRVDANEGEGWWYEGGGIYRHVRLLTAPSAHVQDVYVAPTLDVSSIEASGKTGTATVAVFIEISNVANTSVIITARAKLLDAKGTTVHHEEKDVMVPPGGIKVPLEFQLANAHLWSPETAYLYNATVELEVNGEPLDMVSTNFGIRSVRFDKDQGLFLNEQPVKVKGFCNHQDFAGVGVAVPDRINEWRVTKLQEMGTNAWRMSHNPPNPELLDYTDKHGMLVWDEHRSFCSHEQKICNDTDFLADLRRMVQRDRNHPSVIIWSLCNEVGCSEAAADPIALQAAIEMKRVVRDNDPVNTRAVSGAWNSGWNDLKGGWGPKVMDVQGINYNYQEYAQYHSLYPSMPLIGSETASCTAARGIYFTNNTRGHKDIYSMYECTKDWWTADTAPYIAGGFGWTGFDYKGEPTPYSWPDVNSNFGVIDLAGFPKDTFWWHQAWWTNKDVLHILPHWNEPVGFANPDEKDTCDTASFPLNLDDVQCIGLAFAPQAKSLDACLQACCSNKTCETYQWNATNHVCWIGPMTSCYGGAPGWQSRGRRTSVQVWAYTNAHEAELFLNNVSMGRQVVQRLGKASWNLPYKPGTLRAVGYHADGHVVAQEVVKTTGPPAALRLTVEKGHEKLRADGADAGLVAVAVVDAEGLIVPTASNMIDFSLSGLGKILGVGNGDPSCHEPDKATSRSAFNGLARVVVGEFTEAGMVTVSAKSPGLKAATVEIIVTADTTTEQDGTLQQFVI